MPHQGVFDYLASVKVYPTVSANCQEIEELKLDFADLYCLSELSNGMLDRSGLGCPMHRGPLVYCAPCWPVQRPDGFNFGSKFAHLLTRCFVVKPCG